MRQTALRAAVRLRAHCGCARLEAKERVGDDAQAAQRRQQRAPRGAVDCGAEEGNHGCQHLRRAAAADGRLDARHDVRVAHERRQRGGQPRGAQRRPQRDDQGAPHRARLRSTAVRRGCCAPRGAAGGAAWARRAVPPGDTAPEAAAAVCVRANDA
jgi:hypothetical protein